MQYYILTQDGVFFELDSTTEITVNLTGKATDFPLESGRSAVDHYVNMPKTVSFSGTITDMRPGIFLSQGKTPTQRYIEGIMALKESKQPFSIFYSDRLTEIDNCVFQTIEISQNQQRGSREGASSYAISFTAKQIRFARQAQRTTVPQSAFEDFAQTKSEGLISTEQPEPEKQTLYERAIESFESAERLQTGGG